MSGSTRTGVSCDKAVYALREFGQQLKRADEEMNNNMIEKVFTLELSEEEKDNVLNFILRGKDFAQMYTREVKLVEGGSEQSYRKFKETVLGAMRENEDEELEMIEDYVAVRGQNEVRGVHAVVSRAAQVLQGIQDERGEGQRGFEDGGVQPDAEGAEREGRVGGGGARGEGSEVWKQAEVEQTASGR
jgi:hypothetical protein